MIGKTVAHFESGIWDMCKARNANLNRFVALKVLPPETVTNQDRRLLRCEQVARAASALNYPNIFQITHV